MDEQRIQQLVAEWKSLREIAAECGTSLANTRYWLRKYGLKTKRGPRGLLPKDISKPRRCACGETDPSKFYGNKKDCKRCADQRTVRLAQGKKAQAMEFLGGSCRVCGYSEHLCSLDLHHPNPGEKDPAFTSWRNWSWGRIQVELSKCILLCKNCHAAVHAGKIHLGVAQSG